MSNRFSLRPIRFSLQWHITERCNWCCKHCYQKEKYIKQELSVDELFKIFKQYLELIEHFDTIGPDYASLSLAGGEPLLREDFFTFLTKIYKYNKNFYLSVLSNGSFIDNKNAKRLKSLGVKTVQVSLEGTQRNNDAIRGEGAYQKVIKAIKILVKSKIDVAVSLTLTKKNVFDILPLISLCEELGVAQLKIRRLIPIGRGEKLKEQLLSPLALRECYLYLKEKKERLRKKGNLELMPGCEEGILSQETKEALNSCAVTEGRTLNILPNGDVIPCRRLPIKLGNVFKKSLLEIYYTSNKLAQLINLKDTSLTCQQCEYFGSCLSGGRCLSYAYFGKLSVPDPQCWRIFEDLPDQRLFEKSQDRVSKRQKVHFSLLCKDLGLVNR